MGYMNSSGSSFCKRCGSEIQPPMARFCGRCGASTETTVPVKRNINKKLIMGGVIVGIAILVAVVAVLVIGLNKPRTRTVMVYMIGSDLESSYSAASLDIREMLDAEHNAEDTKVVVYTGGTKKWTLDEVSEKENAVFELKDGELNKTQVYEKKVMTKPETLTEFINYAYENYKSNYYDLILWDHGGGPILGYGSDENSLSKTPMTIKDLSEALANSKVVKEHGKFELIGFDACLMGALEVANALSEHANYMIASEELEPGKGWSYIFLKDVNRDNDAASVSKRVIDEYVADYEDYRYDVDLSLSAIDLTRVKNVAEAVDRLFARINDEVDASTFSKYSRALKSQKVYGYTGRDSSSYDLVDLVDLTQNVSDMYPGEVAEVKSAAEKAIIYNKSNMDHTNGLSFYFPTNNKKQVDKLVSMYEDVAISDGYYNFLKKYAGFITGNKNVTRAAYSDLPVKTSEESAISVELDDELAENYQKGEVMIFRKLGENKFVPIYRSSEVELDGNMLKTNSTNLQFVVKATDADGNTEYGWVALYEKERTETYTDYVAVGLVGYKDEATSLGWGIKNQNTIVRVYEGDKVAKLREMRITNDDETGLPSKTDIEQEGIIFLEYPVWVYGLLDENGQVTDDLVSTGEAFGTSVNTEKGGKIEFMLTDLDFDFGDMYQGQIPREAMKDYYAEFIVYDTQGEAHRLNLVHIE